MYKNYQPKANELENASEEVPVTSTNNSESYVFTNTALKYQVNVPKIAKISVYKDLNSGVITEEKSFTTTLKNTIIEVDGARITICNECGPFGLGIDNIQSTNTFVIDGKTYTATGFALKSNPNIPNFMTVKISEDVSVQYGIKSETTLTDAQVVKAKQRIKEIIESIKFI